MEQDKVKIKQKIKQNYGKIITDDQDNCCSNSSCCGERAETDRVQKAQKMGYEKEALDSSFAEANFALGCGNPRAIASLQKGETVLDLGSGAGFDAFLAAREVGEKGKVIGIDMTEEMVEKARLNARKNNFKNVEFILAEIEELPLAEQSVDVIISNCVINLSTNKKRVFSEAKRVLKKGGRLAISDILRLNDFPKAIKNDLDNYSSCVTGSITKEELISILTELNFKNISIERKNNSNQIVEDWSSKLKLSDYIYSAYIKAEK
ncbi:arsenite methyltransferase [Halanaerobium sp. Z-7514]|uniref:Arsenite methyltransferase n=1 Tax=Halanaerobium polyolivorans TaxID=2886943 RepID=A0AAW4X1K6_9FIRM|nr:arsenite methyltransferase [Halanaerobium polyolivorans]MCC3145696.1 arsenite methyltransferase [Halanaerobium polyolivorans]